MSRECAASLSTLLETAVAGLSQRPLARAAAVLQLNWRAVAEPYAYATDHFAPQTWRQWRRRAGWIAIRSQSAMRVEVGQAGGRVLAAHHAATHVAAELHHR